MAEESAGCFARAKAVGGLAFTPDDHDGKPITGIGSGACKRIISPYFMRHMTATEIGQRASYHDGTGAPRHEVREWIEAIRARLQ